MNIATVTFADGLQITSSSVTVDGREINLRPTGANADVLEALGEIAEGFFPAASEANSARDCLEMRRRDLALDLITTKLPEVRAELALAERALAAISACRDLPGTIPTIHEAVALLQELAKLRKSQVDALRTRNDLIALLAQAARQALGMEQDEFDRLVDEAVDTRVREASERVQQGSTQNVVAAWERLQHLSSE